MPIIDREFENLLPRLADDDPKFLALVESIRDEGCRDPIVTWHGIVIDGHHRIRACALVNRPYVSVEIELPDRAAALAWIVANQATRRNLSDDQTAALCALSGVAMPEHLPTGARINADRISRQSRGREALEWMLAHPKRSLRAADSMAKRLRGEFPTPRPRRPASPASPADPVATRIEAREESQAKKERNSLADRCAILQGQVDLFARPQASQLPEIRRHPSPSRTSPSKREATAVALLSDVHAGETVSRTAAVDNFYSPEVCRIRLRRFFAGLIWQIEKERTWAEIRDLVLWFGGDMVTGHIHEELAETSQSSIETITWLEPELVAGVQAIQESADVRVQLVCSYGNHGRDTHKIRRATGAEHSYEWGMYQRLGRQLEGVGVLADKGAHQYVRVYGRTLHFHHGDEIRYNGGVGGIMIPGNKAVAAWDLTRRADIHHFGHYHQYLDAGRIVFNGSVKGFDAFAMSIKASAEIAQQAFYILDSKRGKTACSPIWVTDVESERLAEAAC